MVETRKNPYAWLFVGGGILLVLAAVTWAMLNKPGAPATTAIPATTATVTPASVSQVQRVSLEDARAALDSKTAVFLDVRDSSSYATSHIPGAVLIPIADLSARMGELDPNAWIIPYCT